MANWWNKAVGEMSKLRDNVMGRFGITIGSTGSGYKLDSSRVDYEMAKQLYYNTNDDYKLGAGFAKSIINNTVSFMGIPQFKIVDKEAQEIIDSFFKNNISNMQRTIRDSLRDGDCFVWITREEEEDATLYPEQNTRLVYNVIPPGQVKGILRHPLTGAIYEYKLVSSHEWEDERGDKKKQRLHNGSGRENALSKLMVIILRMSHQVLNQHRGILFRLYISKMKVMKAYLVSQI